MKQYQKVDVEYEEFENSGRAFIRQYADRNEATLKMRENGFDCYKVVAEYEEYIEVVFGKITQYYDETI